MAKESAERDLALQSRWSIWYDQKKPSNNDKGQKSTKDWKQNLHKVGDFNTVLSFWRYYAWTRKPSDLDKGTSLYVFRGDVEPMWESFPNGGCWFIRFDKNHVASGVIDRVWEELLLAVVGEQFRTPELVGVSLAARQNQNRVSHIISIWNNDSKAKQAAKFRIGERLKVLLHLAADSTIEYKLFQKAIEDGSTYRGAQPYTYVAV